MVATIHWKFGETYGEGCVNNSPTVCRHLIQAF